MSITEKYYQEIDSNYRWNFFWMALDNMMFYFIFMGMSPYTILPFYIQKFMDSKVLVGLIPTIYLVGSTLPQIIMAEFLRKRRERKKYLLTAAFIQRMGILGIFLLSLAQPRFNLQPKMTLLIFFTMHTLQHFASGFYMPAWVDFLGKSIPRKRGILFGVSNLMGGFMGLGVGWLLSYLLEQYPFQQAMPIIFGISLFASLISFISIINWKEVIPPEEFFEEAKEKEVTKREVLADRNFLNYLIWRGSLVILEIATPFYSISALSQLRLEAAQVGVFTTILSFSQAILNPLWGWLGDQKGFLLIIKISAAAGVLAAVLAISTPTLYIYYLIFFLVGFMLSGLQIASINIIFDFSPKHLVPLYTAVSQIALTPLSSIVPLLGGVIAEKFGYIMDYWLAAGLGLIGLLGLSITVKNPNGVKRGYAWES